MHIRLRAAVAAALSVLGCTALAAPAAEAGVLSLLPGSCGSPASFIASLARILLPIIRIISGRGPMKPSPECWTISANSAFSLRKP